MRFIRFATCFALIGGAVLLFHSDASARPAAPTTLLQGTTMAMAQDDGGSRGRSGFLGVSVTRMGDQLRESFEVPEGVGVLIEEVEPDSPAQRAGLKAGDVIVSFDGEDVASSSQLARAIRGAGADTQIALGFYRKGRYRQESVALGARTTQRIARFDGPAGSEDWSDEEWEQWGEEFGQRMEQWGEEFGRSMEQWGEEFGASWEAKGEQWAEFGERMGELGERLGEQWGEEQAESWEQWGEEFGERMEEWGERFGEQMEAWGERWEEFDDRELTEEEMAELKATLEDTMGSVDWDGMSARIQADVENAMSSLESVDWERIQRDVQDSLDDVNWDEISVDVNSAIREAIEKLEEAGVLVERSER